jgi:hypothetical protein
MKILLGVAGAALLAGSVNATVLTRTYSFKVWDLTNYENDVPPVDPVIGSVTLTLDNTQTVIDQTTGITLNGLNVALGSPIAFSYYVGNDSLVIGGLQNTVSSVAGQTDDFLIQIFDVSTNPYIWWLSYSYVGQPGNNYLTLTSPPRAMLSVTPAPEPATWAMMLGGFGAIGGAMRARRKVAVGFG